MVFKVFRWKNKNYISKKYFDVLSSTVLLTDYYTVYLFILDYKDCFNFGSALSYARKSYWIIQRKRRHRDESSTSCTKIIGFVDEFFPNNLGGKHEFMLAIENMSMAKTRKFFHGFYAFAVQSLPVQLIALKKFSVINDIFSKMYHQVSRWHRNTR